jgi:hypothetical protein
VDEMKYEAGYIKGCFDRGVKMGATHVIIVCDTYDWEDYPVFVMPGEDAIERFKDFQGNMQKVMEVYKVSLGWEAQASGLVFNY